MRQRLFAFLLVPVVFFSCTTNNVTVDNSLQKYFDSAGVRGTFGLYDNGQGHFTIYNLARFRDSAYAPGETFDVLLGLVALQTGVASNENSLIVKSYVYFEGDSAAAMARVRSRDTSAAAGEYSLKDIFKGLEGSIGTYMLTTVLGKDTLKKWVDSLHYGNRDISGIVDSGRIEGRLKITADEQMGLTKKLYFDQLPFFQRPQQIVRSLFRTERNSNYLLAYKTGSWVKDGKTLGWIVGWEEENKHPYFFVLNFEANAPNLDVPTVGLQLVKKCLTPMGFFAGKK